MGGALFGLMPPIAAVAVTSALGFPIILAALGRIWREIDRRPLRGPVPAWPDPPRMIVALVAAAATGVVTVWLARQIFDLGPLTVGTREVGGESIIATECWSSALGAVWKSGDNVTQTYNTLFEQIGFGMFPWAIVVPLALGAVATGVAGEQRRFGGQIALGWAAAAWFVSAVWTRKIGFIVYPGFPACALGVGIWLDAVIDEHGRDDRGLTNRAWALVGLLAFAGVVVMAKDLGSFTDRLTSLMVGTDQIKYPANARFLLLPMKTWLWIIGIGVSVPFAAAVWWPRYARYLLPAALVMTAVAGLFWTQGWHRGLSPNLSSKHVFHVYRSMKKTGEPLGIMGSMGNAPRYYAGGTTETIPGRDQLLAFLQRPTRVFALVPASELCPIHNARSESGGGYHVLDDTNAKWMLLSNQLGGASDRNPLKTAMTRTPPEWLKKVGEKDIATWDNQIKLVGFRMPQRVKKGSKFEVTLVFKVIAPISGAWKIFAHFDLGSSRFIGDHPPIRERCQTSYWKVGDYVIDTFEVEAGNASFPAGGYDVWVGFFTGSNPNWRNMTVSAAPADRKDSNNRVKLGQIRLTSGRGCCDAGGDGTGAMLVGGLVLLALLLPRRTRARRAA
jgi:uncharacterized protein (TIGR03382 family)